jgi:hypothetical protein
MSHLPTTSLPSDERFERRSPESFVDDAAVAPMISSWQHPWQERSYHGEDFAGRDDLNPIDSRRTFPPLDMMERLAASSNRRAATQDLIEENPPSRSSSWLSRCTWIIFALIVGSFIALCLAAAFRPDLLDSIHSQLPENLLRWLP